MSSPMRSSLRPSATADYLETILPAGARLYVIGMEGLRVPLRNKGFEFAEDDVDAVVVGIDWNVTYNQLKHAALNIRAGAKFIGTNGDRTFPNPEGIVPGNGALLAAIETATDVKPIVIGKPEPVLYQMALKRMQRRARTNAGAGRSLGDRYSGRGAAESRNRRWCSAASRRANNSPRVIINPIGCLTTSTALKNAWANDINEHESLALRSEHSTNSSPPCRTGASRPFAPSRSGNGSTCGWPIPTTR